MAKTPRDVGPALKDPFSAVRVGPVGPDNTKHLFAVKADGARDLVASGYSFVHALINGASGSEPAKTREAVQKLCDELNAVWRWYTNGEFHE